MFPTPAKPNEVTMHRLGIRREDKNKFERRTPLIPEHIAKLSREKNLLISLEPSPRRVFSDEDYRASGATLADSLEDCAVIMGVKEIPPEKLCAGKVYVFFSHTIKGQPQTLPMLRRLLELGCTLIDYEKIVDEKGQRLVFFGRHAGLAGMIDTLWSLGQRLAAEGIKTPFAEIQPAWKYQSLEEAKTKIAQLVSGLRSSGLPPEIRPLTFGVTGYGNVSRGAQEILDLLQPKTISPEELCRIVPGEPALYKTVFREEHLVERRAGTFELQDYYDHPAEYRSIFSRYLDQLSVLVNCIYWDTPYPRLVTQGDLYRLYGNDSPKLKVIGDISCDVNGSIEATVRATASDNPVYTYDVSLGRAIDGILGKGPTIMAVDNLPAELPKDASEFFSTALLPFIPALAAADFEVPFDRCELPAALRKAVIAYRGALTPNFSYLSKNL
jgi:alanine dehydrogenase